jgi:predicted O-linked N-acetylglucosamine transferase (SPINDLY family)
MTIKITDMPMNTTKISRNDPCPCGSGKKYKQCCLKMESTGEAQAARFRESIPDLFKQALKLDQAGKLADAEVLYQKILEINPRHCDSMNNLGILLTTTGRADAAIELLHKALRLEPSARIYSNLGYALSQKRRYQDAIDCLRKAVTLNPGDAISYSNLGQWLSIQMRFDEAIFYLKKSIALTPTHMALGNLGMCLMALGKFQEATGYFELAIANSPQTTQHYHNLLFSLCFDRSAFANNYLPKAQLLEKVLTARAGHSYQHWNLEEPGNGQPLRIGLVSGDFRNHPVSYFLESILQHLDPSRIEVIAYSTQNHEDEVSVRLRSLVTQWVSIAAMSDRQAAEVIHSDNIHILMDLAGHTAHNRLAVFAWKPAPVQVSWLGYFASTGQKFIDYFLADSLSLPPALQVQFTEKVYNLPHTRLCFTPPAPEAAGEVTETPALKNGYVTFGCFQNSAKINDKILHLWANILRNCPGSKLKLKNHALKDPATKLDMVETLALAGISSEQVILEENSSRDQYFTAYSSVDIMLDTFPYPGGTTTCEALWMGVPTLTLSGDTLLERQGMSMLYNVGLTNWVATNETDYIQKAIDFAGDPLALNKLRLGLRSQMAASPLVDATLFAQEFEMALNSMWREKFSVS